MYALSHYAVTLCNNLNFRYVFYSKTKEKLIQQLKNTPLHLKLDSVTRHATRYFGLNAQFATEEGQIEVKTLALRSTYGERHTGEFIKRYVIFLVLVWGKYVVLAKQLFVLILIKFTEQSLDSTSPQ